jgi:hypothetical protein
LQPFERLFFSLLQISTNKKVLLQDDENSSASAHRQATHTGQISGRCNFWEDAITITRDRRPAWDRAYLRQEAYLTIGLPGTLGAFPGQEVYLGQEAYIRADGTYTWDRSPNRDRTSTEDNRSI